MIDCCELALRNAQLAQNIAIGAFALIALLLAMFFGYNLKLDGRTANLEKKNGAEQKRIDELANKFKYLESLLLLNKNLTNNVPPAPPIAPTPSAPQPKPQPKSQPTDFVQELKDKQSQGKLKPSEFK